MELLLQYCWKHRLLPYANMVTTEGEQVEVVDPGLQNYDAGPDFFNSKVSIGGSMWAGNVEIHQRSSDWYVHGHETDKAYNNVILHVVETCDREDIITEDGRRLPQMVISVPERISKNYRELLSIDAYPPCYQIIPNLKSIYVHSWMAALQTERLMQKTDAINHRLKILNNDWEHVFFVTLARSLGMGNNSDALEQWAMQLPLFACGHHRDDLFQIEALFFGQAGMLESKVEGQRSKADAASDPYFIRLKSEYEYLSHKFSLDKRMPVGYYSIPEGEGRGGASDVKVPGGYPVWKLMRMRPQNYPHIRIAQLARLYHESRISLSSLLACHTLQDLEKMLHCGVSDYWETHYTFGHESARNSKQITIPTVTAVMINCAIPMLFAYGRTMGREDYCERAFDILESLKPEGNNITRMWREVGLEVHNAGDSQALIQLKKQYCDRKDCLRCRIGHEFLKHTQ